MYISMHNDVGSLHGAPKILLENCVTRIYFTVILSCWWIGNMRVLWWHSSLSAKDCWTWHGENKGRTLGHGTLLLLTLSPHLMKMIVTLQGYY